MTLMMDRRSALGILLVPGIAAAFGPMAHAALGEIAGPRPTQPTGLAPVAGFDWESREFTSKDGTRLVYRVLGTGAPLVIVHGGLSSPQAYYAIAQMLKNRYRLYLLERRNYGVSELGKSTVSYDREGEDVHALLKVIGGDSFVFGHSGGALVTLCALKSGANIRKAILYEPPLTSAGPRVRPILRTYRALLAAGKSADALTEGLFGIAGDSRERAAKNAAYFLDKGDVFAQRSLFAADCELQSLIKLDPEPGDWRKLSEQILFMTGEISAEEPLRGSVRKLHALLPKSSVVEFKGQGHIANITAPKMVADALVAFCV